VKVVAIHIAKARKLPTRTVDSVVAEAGTGLVGDRYHGTRHRHVTIQSREQLDEAAASSDTRSGRVPPGAPSPSTQA